MGKVKLSLWLLAVLTVAVVTALVLSYHGWQPWVARQTASQNTPGSVANANYWGGFGQVFPWEVGFFIGMGTFAYQHGKRHNCHVHRCLRLGSYPIDTYRVCKKHHYEVVGSHSTINTLKGVHSGRPRGDTPVDRQPDCR